MFRIILLSIVFFWVSLVDGFCTTYFVAPDGSDSNPGTSERPWRTPGFGSKRLRAGDVLVIRPGTYDMSEFDADMITPRNSGTSESWIVIRGESSDNRPVLRGRGSLFAAIDLSGKSYIKVENLEITSLVDSPYSGGLREGIDAGGSGGGDVSHIEIRNVLIHHVEETGINVSGNGDHLRFENVHIHHTGMASLGCPSPEGGPGWRNVVIYKCIFEYAGMFYQGKENPSPYDRPDGFGIEDSQGPVEIAYSVSQFNLGDGLDSKARNTFIHHCLVANNFGDGVKLWGAGSRVENCVIFGTGYPRPTVHTPWTLLIIETDDRNGDFHVINNTLFDDSSRPAHYSMVVQYDNSSVPINLVMKNNIIAGLNRAYVGGIVNLTARNNLFFNRNESEGVQLEHGSHLYTDTNIGNLGPGNIYGDPKFVNATWGPEGDFHLRPDSPAIDKGADHVGAVDFEMDPRVWSTSVDIGADEYRPAKRFSTGVFINGADKMGVEHKNSFRIDVSLDPKGSNETAEYYLWAVVPGLGVYWYQYPDKWIHSDSPLIAYQGGLVSLSHFKVFEANGSGLPLGQYMIYFAVDTNLDGQVDWSSVSVSEMYLYEN